MTRSRSSQRYAWLGLWLYFALVIAASAYFRARTFDYRSLESARLDVAWQLELDWLARHGRWSGRDFFYSRGPLWQLLAYLVMGGPGASLARRVTGLETLYQTLGVILAGIFAWRTLAPGYRRVLAFAVLASISFAAGIATFRGMVSAALVLLLLPDARARPGFRPALAPAAVFVLMLAFSFDRAAIAVGSVVGVCAAEWLARRRRGEESRIALSRAGYFALAVVVVAAVASVLGLALGMHPVAYVVEQRQLAGAYPALASAWQAGVRVQNVLGLLLAAFVLASVLVVRRSAPWLGGAWIAGALPAAAFAVVLPDAGHVWVALTPLLVVLTLMALRAEAVPWSRASAGLLAAATLLGWFGARPSDLWTRPQTFLQALDSYRGRSVMNPYFVTDVSRTVRFARAHPGGCMAFAPSLTIAHALADMPGPTVLSLRWNQTQRARLAAALRRDRCEYYVHQLLAFDSAEGSEWILGDDFLTIAELYRPARQLGPATEALVLRDTPAPAKVIARTERGVGGSTPVPGHLSVPLGVSVGAEHLVRLDAKLGVSVLAAQLGAAPVVEYRFEYRGKPLGEYRSLYQLEPNHPAQAYVAIDARVAEARWMLGRSPPRERQADTLSVRLSPRGRLTPEQVSLTLSQLLVLAPGSAPVEPVARACDRRVDLAREVARGVAWPRSAAPRAEPDAFSLDPTPAPEARAEIFFPLSACDDSCLSAELAVRGNRGDGVGFEAHVIARDGRPRIASEHVAAGANRRFEVALWPYAHQPALLRLGSLNGDTKEGDYFVIAHPEVARCSARVRLETAVSDKAARVEGSAIEVRGRKIRIGPQGGAVRYPFRVTRDTCLSFDVAVEGGEPATSFELYAFVVVDGIEHRLVKKVLGSGAHESVGPIGLFDWDGRAVELLVAGLSRQAAPDVRGIFDSVRLHRCGAP